MSTRPWDIRLRRLTWDPVPKTVSVRRRVRITALLGLPLAVYLLRNYIGSLPSSIIEAARIDGADHFTIFWRLFFWGYFTVVRCCCWLFS